MFTGSSEVNFYTKIVYSGYMEHTNIYIVGDTHGQWNIFNNFIDKTCCGDKENIIIVTGDFGYWPYFKKYDLSLIKCNNTKIYFCPGNHEHWYALKDLEDKNPNEKIIEVHKNIFYCTFGSVLTIESTNFMFCGGADSIDKNSRTMGLDWFPEEVITMRDMYQLPERNDIDVIISHTGPRFVLEQISRKFLDNQDPSTKMLDIVYEKYVPKKWFFGHFHKYITFKNNFTEFYCLDMLGGNSTNHLKF